MSIPQNGESSNDRADTDVYETIAGLPDDEVQVGLLESFHESCTTLAIGQVTVSHLNGLPPYIDHVWRTNQTGYTIDFAVGHIEVPGLDSDVVIKLAEAKSELEIAMVKKADSKIYSVFDERRRQLGTVEPSTVRKILTSMSGDSLPMYEARNDSMYMEILLGGLGEMYGYSERNLLLTAPNLEQHPDDRGAVTSGAILYSQQETISDSTRAFVIERLQQFEDLDADVVKRMKVSYSCEAFRTKDADTTPAYVALEKIVASPAKYRVDDIKCDVVINGQTSILETTPDNLKLFVSTLEEVIGSASDHIVMPGQP